MKILGTKVSMFINPKVHCFKTYHIFRLAKEYKSGAMSALVIVNLGLMPVNDISFKKLQNLCLEAGVKVVKTPSLNNAPISGATRWLSDTPLIQLTDNANQIDHFGFTFFHEVGHILLHGKKDVFLENLEYSDKDNQKENEADEFARKWA